MPRIVISASRRTDIPAFYMPWFMSRIHKGHFELTNPYSKQTSLLKATPDHVHTIVFWSKNFAPFLEGRFGQKLRRKGYHLFFNFTINSPHPTLEPAVPELGQRLIQLSRLADQFGPQTIQWRFDPICHYRWSAGDYGDNLDRFAIIADHAAKIGIPICITSFVDLYPKVKRRQQANSLEFIDPTLEEKIVQIESMAKALQSMGIQLQLCCEKEVLAALPTGTSVQGASCIPNHRLAQLYGDDLSMAKDTGQRSNAGCGCRISKDIGSYHLHPCHHNCLFCYANPAPAPGGRRKPAPDEDRPHTTQ